MRILTNLVFHIRTGRIGLHTYSEWYEGPVVYAGGGSDTVVNNESVASGPFGPQIPFILQLFDQAAKLYQQGPLQAFPGVDAQGNVVAPGEQGSLTAGINPNLGSSQAAVGPLAGQNIGQNLDIQQLLQQLGQGGGAGPELGQSLTGGIQQGINAQLGAGDNAQSEFAGQAAPGAQDAFSTIFGQQAPSAVTASGTQGGQANVNPALEQLLAGGGGQNPFLDQLVQSAVQSQVNQFNRNVLPVVVAIATPVSPCRVVRASGSPIKLVPPLVRMLLLHDKMAKQNFTLTTIFDSAQT